MILASVYSYVRMDPGPSFVDGNGSIRDIVTFFVQSPVNHQDQRIINKTINHIHKLYLTHRDTRAASASKFGFIRTVCPPVFVKC